jgi:homoserine dehydrogenase
VQQELTVLKFGGSVLRDEADLRTAVHEVYRWLRRGGKVIAVVSAFDGTTDRLIRQGQAVTPETDPVATPLLLATGELTTASLVVLALRRAGIPATALNPASAGLRTDGVGVDANPLSIDHAAIRRELETHSVVVVPGFVGVDERQQFTLLGRGGSDLTALFIASELGATRCRLIKDVDGLYEHDPALAEPPPRRFESISWDAALQLDEGIVQHKGLRFARARGLCFEVGAFNRDQATRVGACETRFAPLRAAQEPLRVVLLGLGTVGLGVYESLRALPEWFSVVAVGCRDRGKALGAGVPESIVCTDLVEAISQEADVVVELIGGLRPAAKLIDAALRLGRNVVTANKAVIAAEGARLEAVADECGSRLRYSAAVGGSVPVLEFARVISERAGVRRVEGVLNGTSNYVLNQVRAGSPFAEAVRAAQRAGFAEADPTRDLSGVDAAEKLVVIALTAIGVELDVADITREELSEAALARCDAAGGSVVRQIAWLECSDAGDVRAGVDLRRVGQGDPFHDLPAATNRVRVQTRAGEWYTLTGAGAGRWPTSESVIADLLDLARGPRTACLTSVTGDSATAESAVEREVAHVV